MFVVIVDCSSFSAAPPQGCAQRRGVEQAARRRHDCVGRCDPEHPLRAAAEEVGEAGQVAVSDLWRSHNAARAVCRTDVIISKKPNKKSRRFSTSHSLRSFALLLRLLSKFYCAEYARPRWQRAARESATDHACVPTPPARHHPRQRHCAVFAVGAGTSLSANCAIHSTLFLPRDTNGSAF